MASAAVIGLHGYTGDAHARDGRLLYREQHLIWSQDGHTRRLVVYRCPDGQAFARKHLLSEGTPATPAFRLRDGVTGQEVEVKHDTAGVTVSYQARANAVPKQRQLSLPAQAIIDAGFDAYVHEHWSALLNGAIQRVHFLVPSRREWMNFTVRRVASDSGSVTYRLELGRWFAFLLPHVDVRYSLGDRRLLEYRGPSNLSDAQGNNPWVDIRFPAAQVFAQLPVSELQAAEQTPLDGRCAL